MKYSLDQILTFIHVVETGSFTQAALKLEMSKSIVSQRITALEAYLDTQLLLRTTRSLDLTDAGREFYQGVKSTFNDIERSVQSVKAHRSVAKGKLKVLISSGFSRTLKEFAKYDIWEKVIPDFIAAHPEVHLHLRTVEDPLACLGEDFDCLIFPHIKGLPLPDFDFVAKRIMDSDVGIFASPAYLARYGVPTHPDDLSLHNCVATFSGYWPLKTCTGEIFYINTTGNLKVNDDGVLKSAILHDVALGYTYKRLVTEEVRTGQLQEVLMDYTQLKVEIFALYPQSYYMPYKIKVFLEVLDTLKNFT